MKTILAALLLTLGCATVQPTPAPGYTCATACARGTALDCDWARWNPIAGSCAAQCVDWEQTWGYDLKCMSLAATCAAAENCQNVEKHARNSANSGPGRNRR